MYKYGFEPNLEILPLDNPYNPVYVKLREKLAVMPKNDHSDPKLLMRKEIYIGDGDSKTSKAILDLDPYNNDPKGRMTFTIKYLLAIQGVKSFDASTLTIALDSDPIISGCAEEQTKDLMKRVTQACDASMPRKHGINQRPSVHWWNDHISALRKECLRKRRISQRGYRRPDSAELVADYKKARRSLNKAIKDSKRKCWMELINEVDKDPWGRPYKQQVEHVTAKASVVRASLARLMPNVGGPKQSRRLLLSSVVTSVLTYGISIWANALDVQASWRKAGPIYRQSALRVASAFRTTSEEAVCVISGTLPLRVLAEERRALYHRKSVVSRADI
ncbi:hypothetical protein NQ318_015603 [Aromia moschata]|uniref:Reverse transcriptase n=1 Tax=Aromia moschata TaxID=1265417 RepID=A0AAV8XBE7_9CUCU|nr:hypothetical protein NQ318_015603 [Aromia moschata]